MHNNIPVSDTKLTLILRVRAIEEVVEAVEEGVEQAVGTLTKNLLKFQTETFVIPSPAALIRKNGNTPDRL